MSVGQCPCHAGPPARGSHPALSLTPLCGGLGPTPADGLMHLCVSCRHGARWQPAHRRSSAATARGDGSERQALLHLGQQLKLHTWAERRDCGPEGTGVTCEATVLGGPGGEDGCGVEPRPAERAETEGPPGAQALPEWGWGG